MDKKVDRRVLRTREAIKDAFFKLLDSKPVDKISVRELCDTANINRTSFYDHYLDFPDFLDALEEEIAFKMLAQHERFFAQEIDMQQFGRNLLHMVKTNRELQFLFDSRSEHKAFAVYHQALRENVFPQWLRTGRVTQEQAEILLTFIVTGFFAVIAHWCQNGFVQDEEEVVSLLATVSSRGIYAFLRAEG